jgi:predicted nuclease with TOPRIM domain
LELEIKKTRDLTKLVEYYTTMCSTLDDTERVNKELKKENQTLKSKIDELNKQIDQVNTYSSSNLDEE